jgi:hypothetical protein
MGLDQVLRKTFESEGLGLDTSSMTEHEYNKVMNNVTIFDCDLLLVSFEEILEENKEVLIRLKNI